MSGRPAGDPGSSGPRTGDLPRRLLAAAAARTPAGRGEWGRAMLAELDEVARRRDRWCFALGAGRAALVPPRSPRLAGIILAAGAAFAAAAIWAVLPQPKPPVLVVAVAVAVVAGLPALCAWIALARPGPPGQASAAGRAARVLAVAGIAGCPVLAAWFLASYPGNAGGRGSGGLVTAAVFAGELAAFVLLAVRRPGPLAAGPHTGVLGAAAALLTGGVLLHNQPGASGSSVLTPGVALAAAGAPLAAGALAVLAGAVMGRGTGQCLRRGAGEVAWGALLTGPAAFIAVLLTTSRRAITAQAAQAVTYTEAHGQGAASVTAWVARDDLGGALFVFGAASAAGMLIFLAACAGCRVSFLLAGGWPARRRVRRAD